MKPFLAALFVLFLSGCAVVDDGHVGVKKTLGHISDEPLSGGAHFYIPAVSEIQLWNVKLQEIKEQATVPSSEGLISTLDVSVIYQIPANEAPRVRKTIGANYRDQILEPYVRESIRNIVSGYEVKALYSEKGRGEISSKILKHLKEKLDGHGILVQDVLLRDVQLPPSFSLSIENKLRAEQEALQKEFELAKAKKDAEIEVARAEGVAKSNQIIASSITPNYLRYQWVQGLHSSQQKQIVYVPTEANLPILEAGKRGDWGSEPK